MAWSQDLLCQFMHIQNIGCAYFCTSKTVHKNCKNIVQTIVQMCHYNNSGLGRIRSQVATEEHFHTYIIPGCIAARHFTSNYSSS